MAAATMELRPVPHGVDVFIHRGPANLVRLLRSSKILSVVNDYEFTVDPSDAATVTVMRGQHVISFASACNSYL